MKHWTEPNGIFLLQIPVEWQYRNPAIEGIPEEPPYSFEPYEEPLGCFQISCYPLEIQAPSIAAAHPNGFPSLSWNKKRMDDAEFCSHLYFGALADQALIGKYIYDRQMENDSRIHSQLKIVDHVLDSIKIVPKHDRGLASDLDKFDRFTGALAASYDLLYAAIESVSCIEIITVCANQIDAFLRLSLVIAIQLKERTNQIVVKYLFQGYKEKGILERRIFDDALEFAVIDQQVHKELHALYELRNRVIHRYIISNIKTRDLIDIATRYLELSDVIRLTLRKLEDEQQAGEFGVYGKKLHKYPSTYEEGVNRLHAEVNDKHLLGRFKRSIVPKE